MKGSMAKHNIFILETFAFIRENVLYQYPAPYKDLIIIMRRDENRRTKALNRFTNA